MVPPMPTPTKIGGRSKNIFYDIIDEGYVFSVSRVWGYSHFFRHRAYQEQDREQIWHQVNRLHICVTKFQYYKIARVKNLGAPGTLLTSIEHL